MLHGNIKSWRRVKENRGFTLIEVMVAVSIMAVSLSVLLDFEGNTLKSSARSYGTTTGSWLARSKMVDVELMLEKDMKKGEFPEDKEEHGEFEEPFVDYLWEYKLRKVELPVPPETEEGSMQNMIAKQLTQEIGNRVRELKVSVREKKWDEKKKITLTTHLVKLQ